MAFFDFDKWDIPHIFNFPTNIILFYLLTESTKYQAKLDSKKRITIRSPRTEYYVVTEEPDGTVILSPRILIHPDEISSKTLKVMDESVRNFKEGEVSEPVDLDELKVLSET